MKNLYFTVGPSKIYPTVPGHIKHAVGTEVLSMNHRGKEFAKLYDDIKMHLGQLLTIPKDHKIFFLSSAIEAMDRTIENIVETNSFHFVQGSFGERYYQTALNLRKKAQKIDAPFGKGFDFSTVSIPQETELICFTHSDTSTGVQIDLEKAAVFKQQNPKLLYALDTVSSLPYPEIDFSIYDLVFFSVQKGFGLPSGLCILIVSPNAYTKAMSLYQQKKTLGSYHTFYELEKFATKNQTPETPNILDIYLLNEVTKDMLAKGIKIIRKETEEKAAILYDFFEKDDRFSLFAQKKHRSQTIIVVDIRGGSERLISFLKTKGIIVGKGYGEFKDKHIRIANFPAHTLDDVQRLILEIKNFV